MANTVVVVYVDDLLVGGKIREEHDKNLGEVLAKLNEVGMHVNKKKMQHAKERVLFLGIDIQGGNLTLDSYVETQRKGCHACNLEVR